ncbi:MAG: hypothetical protein EAZ95_00925 [Bacteroidetes bacterium]|nr:MAG: hypothetical protein EAZ95_00925 [Bacteroidota bacterium]
MQLDLFPTYPRLSLADLPTPAHDWRQDWKLFDYPTEDDKNMAQSKKQADTIVYLNSVLDAVLAGMKQNYFIGADVFVYFSRKERVKKEAGKYVYQTVQYQGSPDIFLAMGNALKTDDEPESFILEKVLMQSEGIPPRMVAVEILSKSNYKNKDDQKTRFKFYNELGVDEYIVVHTKPEMTFEVYWRLGGTLQSVMFYEKHKYDCPLLDIGFQIETKIKGKTKKGKDILKQTLLAFASDGSKFNNYGTEREIRIEAEAKLEGIAKELQDTKEALTEEQRALREAENERELERIEEERARKEEAVALLEAEKARIEAEKSRIEAEKAHIEAQKARTEEEKARKEAEKRAKKAEKAHLEEQKARMEEQKARMEEQKARIEEQKARLEAEARLRLVLLEMAELRGTLQKEETY